MTIIDGPFKWDRDFETIRSFLIETHKIQPMLNWIPSRFENRKFGPCGSLYRAEEDNHVHIWNEPGKSENAPTDIVGVGIYSPPNEGHVQIHPDYLQVQEYIISWLETQALKSNSRGSGPCELLFHVRSDNHKLIHLLEQLGYQNVGLYAHDRVRSLTLELPHITPPEGIEIRSVDIEEDFERYREVQASVFRHCQSMTREHAKVYRSASFYHDDLDFAAITEDENFAAFCTVRIDPISRIAEFEPVGTHPDFRKRGLGKAIIVHALRKAQQYKPVFISIPGANPSEGASRLYDSVGFTLDARVFSWKKTLD